jgi:hypothetical protein
MKLLMIKCSGHGLLAKRPCFYLTLSPHQRTARGPAPQAQPVTLQEYFEDKPRCAWRPLRFSGHTRARQKQKRAPPSHLRAMLLLVSDVSGCLTWRSAQREASGLNWCNVITIALWQPPLLHICTSQPVNHDSDPRLEQRCVPTAPRQDPYRCNVIRIAFTVVSE